MQKFFSVFLLSIIIIFTITYSLCSKKNNNIKNTEKIKNQKKDNSDTVTLKYPKDLKQKAFKIGERLEFDVKYGFLKIATAEFNVLKAQPIKGREIFMITSYAKTKSFYDMIYKVRDKIISYSDVKSLFSFKYVKIQREGSTRINETIEYDYNKKMAIRKKVKFKRSKIKNYKDIIKLKGFVFDPFSSLYYLRTFDLKVGKTIKFPISSSNSIYEIQIKVEKKEEVKVKAGKFICYKIRPLLLKEGIFLHKGSMDIWLTADQYKIPVKMSSKIAIGSIKAYLHDYRAGDRIFKKGK